MKKILNLIYGFCLVAIFASCEKNNTTNGLTGNWEFYESCNTHLMIGCIKAKNRDFSEKLVVTDNEIIIYYDDSLISTSKYRIIDSLVVYGNNDFAKIFSLENNRLKLIDTCFSCNIITYIRQ